jgi:CubicO group peptidase (beta-lactamase class C family)
MSHIRRYAVTAFLSLVFCALFSPLKANDEPARVVAGLGNANQAIADLEYMVVTLADRDLIWKNDILPNIEIFMIGVAYDAFEVLEPFGSPHARRITWDHLLRQTSDWEGTLWGKPDWADRPRGELDAWRARERNEPGTVYNYNDVRVNLLALAALNVWRRPLPQVLREHVMDPIGASATWRWYGYDNSWIVLDGQLVQSVSGGAHWGGGMWISARDLARFGLLTARGGRWGERRILSEEWIGMATTPGSAQPTYGFMNFFVNTGRRQLPSAPEQAFYHLGAGNNVVYVDPVNDIVIVARWISNLRAMDGVVQRVMDGMR